MANKTILIIRSTEDPEWISCQAIRSNIEKALTISLGTRQKVLNYSKGMSPYDLLCLAAKIKKSKPEYLLFIDHLPHPVFVLEALSKVHFDFLACKIVYFIYGDFTLMPLEWKRCLTFSSSALFVSASNAQKKMVDFFLTRKARQSNLNIPFPIDKKAFFYSPNLAGEFRQIFGLPEDAKIITYTGRLSPEKNVLPMVGELAKTLKSFPRAHLVLAGSFDDLGAEKFGHKILPGSYESRFQKLLASFPQGISSRIHYLGKLPTSRLNALLCASNIFISLSTYHDEDFGMSPLEALATGLPCILTAWGGYGSFKIDRSDQIKLVKVSVSRHGPDLSFASARVAVERLLRRGREKDRALRAALYQDAFGLDKIAHRYRSLFEKTRRYHIEFDENLESYIECFKKYRRGFPLFDLKRKDLFYKKMYSNYVPKR